ncbi:MAG: hypothetical protein AB7R55_16360 [Gemmatimonadales bacterium]
MMTRLAAGLAVAVIGTAVAPRGAPAQQAGNFTATVTASGQDGVRLAGFALSFGSDAKRAWYVQLVTPGGGSTIMLLYAGAGLPPTGEHRIVDFIGNDATPPPGKFVATGNVDPAVAAVVGLSSIGGTITITRSTPSVVEGRFEYRARLADVSQAVVVEGEFESNNTQQ